MTTYVLSEQGDWFEDEIKFLRAVMAADDHFVDIGANYGVYALTAAGRCHRGAVWAYEPCAQTAAHLRESAARNGFAHLQVIQAALSDRSGTGYLATNSNAELNALTTTETSATESVRLTTLDEEMKSFAVEDIGFLKIDAEGHEREVLLGAKEFLARYSPLVMIEIKAGSVVNLEPIELLGSWGYTPFRLVPGLNALVPFRHGEKLDGYLLNLFCCKQDRAAHLNALGRLTPVAADEMGTTTARDDRPTRWSEWLSQLPYGAVCGPRWTENTERNPLPGWTEYRAALNAWVDAQSPDMDIQRRWEMLVYAHVQLSKLTEHDGNFPRLLSRARVAADIGERETAVGLLSQLIDHFRTTKQAFLGEPFLLPRGEFERLPPREPLAAWTVSALLDGFDRLRTFSGYFSPQGTLQVAQTMEQLGFPGEDMRRRAALARAIS